MRTRITCKKVTPDTTMALIYTNCTNGIAATQLHVGELCLFAGDPGTGIRLAQPGHPDSLAMFLCTGDASLICAPPGAVRLNGTRVESGIAALAHKDEIRLAGEVHYFSSESSTAVHVHPADSDARCALCDSPLAGYPAAPCPGCGLLFHARDAADCFCASPNCPSCGAAIGADVELWSPLEARM